MSIQSGRVAFIDIGRVAAAIAVIYTHIDVLLLRENEHHATVLTDAIDHATRFLGMGQYAIGYASVPFFFLVSAFVMPRVAESIGAVRFAVKLLLRVLPLLIVAVVVSALALKAGLRPLSTGPVLPVRLSDVLQNIALVNFLHKPIIAESGVSWSLLPEVIFYLLLLAGVPLLRRQPWLSLALEIAFVAVVLSLHGALGAVFRTFAANTAYVTCAHPAWTALSDRTYSLYLLHGAIAFPVILKLYGTVPLGVAVLTGVVAMLAGVEFAHRLIERPLNNLGRRLSGSSRPGCARSKATSGCRSI